MLLPHTLTVSNDSTYDTVSILLPPSSFSPKSHPAQLAMIIEISSVSRTHNTSAKLVSVDAIAHFRHTLLFTQSDAVPFVVLLRLCQ